MIGNSLYSEGRSDHRYDVDAARRAAFFQCLEDRHDGRAGSQHRVGDDQHFPLEGGRSEVFDHDVEIVAAFPVAPVGRDKRVLRLVETVQQPSVQRKSRPQDRADDYLVLEYGTGFCPQRGSYLLGLVGERFGKFVSEKLPYAGQVAAKAHAVFLEVYIAQLGDVGTEQGFFLAVVVYFHRLSFFSILKTNVTINFGAVEI